MLDAEIARDEILVLIDLVVQAHNGGLPRHANLEFHGDDRHARPADRVDVLDVLDLGQLLFEGERDEILDVVDVGSRERHEHVRHRHVDLRLLLAWRDQHGEQAEQQRQQRQDRRQW